MATKDETKVSKIGKFIKLDTFDKKSRKVIQEHCIMATRISILRDLKNFLINQIHTHKCISSDDTFIPATAAMDTIYNHLMFSNENNISNNSWFSSVQHDLSDLACDESGTLEVDMIYYDMRTIPLSYYTKEYDKYFDWQLSCQLGVTYEDIKIFITYRALLLALFEDAVNKVKTDKRPQCQESINECFSAKKKLENILHQKDLDDILLRTTPNDVHVAESSNLFVRIFNILKKYDTEDVKESCKPAESSPQTNTIITKESEGIYIIREREFMTQDKLVYKLGRSNNMINRARQYPKGSEIILLLKCANSISVESNLITLFSKGFRQCKEYGTEYFEGNINSMIKLAVNTALSQDSLIDSDSEEKLEENTKRSVIKIINTYKSIRIVERTYNTNKDWKLCDEDESEDSDVYVFLYDHGKDDAPIKNGRLPELILSGIITPANISNIRDNKTLINKIVKKKKHINIEHIDQSHFAKVLDYKDVNEHLSVILRNGQRHDRHIETFLSLLLGSNVIINNRYLAVATKRGKKGWQIDETHYINNDHHDSSTGKLETINGKNYEHHTLRINVPYSIEYNSNKEYYFLNRNHKTVGNDSDKWETYPEIEAYHQEYLYKSTDKLFNDFESYSKKVKKFLLDNKLTKRVDKGFALYDF